MTAAKMKSRILTGPQVRTLLDTGECVVFDVIDGLDMPPKKTDETLEQYTDRLTGNGDVPPPYCRNRQCSIGWHNECTDPAGKRCKCPCHCPPHATGERGWVKEEWRLVHMAPGSGDGVVAALYRAKNDDGQGFSGPWSLPTSMPKKCSRLTVETASVAAVEHDGKWCWRELLRKVEGE